MDNALTDLKQGHTPGPWWTDAEWSESECGCAVIAANTDAGPLPGNPTRGMVAWASELLAHKAQECEANARLIAAAPELLAALQEVVNASHGLTMPSSAYIAAERAIARATGAA